MKKIIFLMIIQIVSCQTPENKKLSNETWEEDLTYFSKKILKDYVGWQNDEKENFINSVSKLNLKIPELNNAQVMVEMSRLLVPLKDGHTEMNLLQEETRFNRVPLFFYFFDKELRIIASIEQHKNLVGKKVVSINNIPILEVFNRLKQILAHDNKMEFLHEAPNYMSVPAILHALDITPSNDKLELKIEDENKNIESVSIFAISLDDFNKGNWINARKLKESKPPLFLLNQQKHYYYKFLQNNSVLYFKLNRVNNQDDEISLKRIISEMFKKYDQLNAKFLIVDLRNNRGGNYKKVRPLIEAVKKRKVQGNIQQVIAITNRVTFSAAGVTSIFLKREVDAKLFGEPSRSEPNGGDNVEYFNLPNSKLKVGYTDKLKDHYPELGSSTMLPIDYPVFNTFNDYRNGNDKVLKAVFKYLNKIN